jgi:hypothetical protein
MRGRSRILAEHEAAHAVVARHFGFHVVEIHVGPTRGRTCWYGPAAQWQEAAITAAGDLFNREQGTVPYQDYGCHDLKEFERDHGLAKLWDAQRAARSILVQRRRAVLTLADQLMSQPLMRFDTRGQLVA